ncbi:FeoC-like transcriptional regulator [Rhodobacter capsulatus]|uniref:FeoC-like transcriptional regulator n=1 Tax=Rhodobacter capsulatus TaxID=1061 RepID=UPI004029DC63
MALQDIQDYVAKMGKASLRDLSLHFGSSPEAMRDMAGRLVRKGRLALAVEEAACCGCKSKDGCASSEYYCLPQPSDAA